MLDWREGEREQIVMRRGRSNGREGEIEVCWRWGKVWGEEKGE